MSAARLGYFRTRERREAVQAAAASWLGTPFVANQAIKGGGVDCLRLADAVLSEAGWPHAAPFPEYRVEAGLHVRDLRLLRYFEDSPEFGNLPQGAAYMAGDVLLFGIGHSPYHVGVITAPPHFIHCMRRLKATLAHARDPVFSRIFHSAYRPLES